MAKFIGRDVSVKVNSVDLSEWVKSATVSESWDDVDVTGMGAQSKEHLLGIGDAYIEVEFFQDFAAAAVNATLKTLKGSNTPFPVVVQPTSGSASATNPKFTMQAVLPEYNAIDASVGDASTTKVKFLNADPSGIVETST